MPSVLSVGAGFEFPQGANLAKVGGWGFFPRLRSLPPMTSLCIIRKIFLLAALLGCTRAQQEPLARGSAADRTPPTITSVFASVVGYSSASVHWTTEPSNTHVEDRLTAAYGNATPLDSSLVSTHQVTLSRLTVDTVYDCRAKTWDAEGNPAESGDFTFTSAAVPVTDRKSTRLNSSHIQKSRMPSSA